MKTGDWALARAATDRMGARMVAATQKATLQEAQMYRALVVRAFNSRGKSNGKAWQPLQPATVKAKGSSKPLIDTGQLRNSVQVINAGGVIFVGVPSKVRSTTGGPLVSIAAVHEYGKIIAQRRGDKIVLIKIPARSFLTATYDKHFQPADVRKRYFSRVALAMGGAWAVAAPATARQLAAVGIAEAKAAGGR